MRNILNKVNAKNKLKKIFVLFLCLLGTPVLGTFTSSAFAASNSNPSLSDAIYADLALRNYLDNVSVSFYDGNQENEININETRHWIPASTVKLFAAMYAFKLASDNKLNLSDTVTVDAKNVVPTELVTDELPAIQEGDNTTIERLLKQMITQSDNTAFNVLLDILDRKAITDYIHNIGLNHSAVGSKLNLDTSQEQYEFDVPGYGINTTTSDDYTKAFTFIWENRIPGAKPLLEILKQQKIRNMLPLLLPSNVVVANKTGDLDPLFHDGGIIFSPKTSYVLSVFTNAGDPNLVAHLSQLIYTKDFSLVGAALPKSVKNAISDQNPPLDPLVASGKPLASNILGAQTLQMQTITASDLGITAKDLSFNQSNTKLKKITIPADSPWYFLVPALQNIKKSFALGAKGRSQVDIETTQIQVAEAKDLISRGKVSQATVILNDLQKNMDSLAKSQIVKNNAQAQTTIESVSETRFQVFSDAMKTATGEERNKLITEIGQQAKNTLNEVQPNIPLATNAINPTQKPLIGRIINKTNTSIVVKTSGGQELTIPIAEESPIIKTKEFTSNITITPSVTESESLIPTQKQTITSQISESPSQELTPSPSLANSDIGTTVALVGSSVGNTFTPTFVLLNVPKQLAAPEPVTVVKVNKKDHTMVISENGIPVQVNVGSQTTIRGTDTNVSFNEIKPGEVVVVHGQPLVPVAPANPTSLIPFSGQNKNSVSPTNNQKVPVKPSLNPISSSPSSNNSSSQTSISNSSNTPAIQNQPQPTGKVNISQSVTNPTPPSTNKLYLTITSSPQISQSAKGSSLQPQNSPVNQKTVTPPNSVQTNTSLPTLTNQPKVIQSTSITIIEKTQPSTNSQSQPQPQSQQQTQSHSQPQPAQTNNSSQPQKPAAQPPATQSNSTTTTTTNSKKSK